MVFDLAHSFVDIFAGGLSSIKTIIFFLYLLILAFSFLILKNYSFKTLKWRWFGLGLGVMYLYGLILHIIYTTYNNLPITKFFVVGGNGEVSSSYLWHIHITKAFISQVLFYFGKINFQTMDAGGAYIGALSSPVFLLGALLLATLILQTLIYFVTSFKNLLKDKSKRQIVFLIIFYSIVSFSLIKTSIDGGMFNRGFWVSALFIILFILQKNKKLFNYHYYIITGFGVILSAMSFTKYGANFELASTAALVLLYNAILYGSQKKINNIVLISCFLLFLGSWWVYGIKDIISYKYSKTMLPVGSKAYIYNEAVRDVQILEIEKAQTIEQLTENLNKNIKYLPIMADEVNCQTGKPKISFSVTLISGTPLTKNYFSDSEDIIIKNEASLPFYNKWQTRLYVFLNPCLKETLSIINGELIKNNISNYFLLDMKIPREPSVLW